MASLRAHGVVALAALVLAGGTAAASCPKGHAIGLRGDRIVVGFAPAPPYVVTSSNDSEVRGIAIDLLRALAEAEGWRLDLVELSPETLRTRLAACELDVGVVGVPVSAALAASLELSQPYLSTVTTVIVDTDDVRAAPSAGEGHVTHGVLRGALSGLVALIVLAFASWLLNAFTGVPGGRTLRLRRIDAAVSGPWAGLRWLARSTTGRVLVAIWVVAGIALGTTRGIRATPLLLGEDPLRALVQKSAHTERLVGERYPDGAQVPCSAGDARACFRGFANGTLAAIAGPREVLCLHALELSLDDAVLRDDLAIPEQLAYLLPPGSPLRAHLDVALLRHHEQAPIDEPTRCPGDEP